MAACGDFPIRMKELAEQAATGSYSDPQRALMNSEFGELAKEITRIAETTDFNGVKLLNSTTQYEIHLGSTDASVNTKVQITGEVMDAATLELSASTEYNFLDTHYTGGSEDALSTAVGTTGDGTITFTFAGDTDDAGGVIGDLSIAIASAGTGADTSTYTVSQIVDLINVESQAAQTGYDMASLVLNTQTGQYGVKLTANATGQQTLTVGGTATLVTGANWGTTGNWDVTLGTDTGADISTTAGALAALDTVDAAIETKDTYRAQLGYMMNRLDAAAQVVQIQAENLLQAESRISDVDVATEMAAMTRNQVLSQAGISMLGQANSMPQMALKLLG